MGLIAPCNEKGQSVRVDTMRLHQRPTKIHITESAISRYGVNPLSCWLFLKSECWKNGIVFRGFTEQRRNKFGWSRSVFFSKMRMMEQAGLAKKDEWGNWKLSTVQEVIGLHCSKTVKHRCSVLFSDFSCEWSARDVIRKKMLQMGLRQKEYYLLTPEQRYKQKKISTKAFCKQERVRLLEGRTRHTAEKTLAGIGSSNDEILKFAQSGFIPLNTEALMRTTLLGRTALFAFKKRAKAQGWFTQQDRTWIVPPQVEQMVPFGQSDLQEQLSGKFSRTPSGGWRFHQASLYKSNGIY